MKKAKTAHRSCSLSSHLPPHQFPCHDFDFCSFSAQSKTYISPTSIKFNFILDLNILAKKCFFLFSRWFIYLERQREIWLIQEIGHDHNHRGQDDCLNQPSLIAIGWAVCVFIWPECSGLHFLVFYLIFYKLNWEAAFGKVDPKNFRWK